MRPHIATPAALVSIALSTACTQQLTVAPEELEHPIVAQEFRIIPEIWETSGSEITPQLQLAQGEAEADMHLVFEYYGEGNVSLPRSATIEAGSNQATLDGVFVAQHTGQAFTGTVRMVMVHDEERIPVLDWTILHRPSIIQEVRYTRSQPLEEDRLYACLVAVDYDAMEEGLEAPADRDDRLELRAWVKPQGRFAPEVSVMRDVAADAFPSWPRGFEFSGERKVFYVSVERADYPQMRRAFMTIEVSIGGDSHTIHVALPNR